MESGANKGTKGAVNGNWVRIYTDKAVQNVHKLRNSFIKNFNKKDNSWRQVLIESIEYFDEAKQAKNDYRENETHEFLVLFFILPSSMQLKSHLPF